MKTLIKLIPLLCFTAVVICEIFTIHDTDFIGGAVFGLLVLSVFEIMWLD